MTENASNFILNLAIISTIVFLIVLLILFSELLLNLFVKKMRTENPHFELNQMILNLFFGCKIIALITFVGSVVLWIYYLIIK